MLTTHADEPYSLSLWPTRNDRTIYLNNNNNTFTRQSYLSVWVTWSFIEVCVRIALVGRL